MTRPEWSRYYRLEEPDPVEVLHARFVTHRYARHAHDYFVVGLVERGTQSFTYRGSRHITPRGHVFLVNPEEPHTGEAATPAGYVYRTFYPPADLLSHIAADLGSPARAPCFRAAVVDDPQLARMLARFHRSVEQPASAGEQNALLLEALGYLITRHADLGSTPRPAGSERPAVRRAREYLESHYADDVSLATLAGFTGLSPYYLARAFSREVGVPPHVYLDGVRIRKARECLDRGVGIAESALLAGYADQSHFSRRFKHVLGISPGQYLRQSKIRQDRPVRSE